MNDNFVFAEVFEKLGKYFLLSIWQVVVFKNKLKKYFWRKLLMVLF